MTVSQSRAEIERRLLERGGAAARIAHPTRQRQRARAVICPGAHVAPRAIAEVVATRMLADAEGDDLAARLAELEAEA